MARSVFSRREDMQAKPLAVGLRKGANGFPASTAKSGEYGPLDLQASSAQGVV